MSVQIVVVSLGRNVGTEGRVFLLDGSFLSLGEVLEFSLPGIVSGANLFEANFGPHQLAASGNVFCDQFYLVSSPWPERLKKVFEPCIAFR
jgi:hypothetical protein